LEMLTDQSIYSLAVTPDVRAGAGSREGMRS
jgi:hypothetical protein